MPKADERIVAKPAAGEERRRTKRVPLSFQIEVSGRDRNGAAFCERAMTSDVNHGGCKFDLLWELKPGDLVSIALVPKDRHLTGAQPPIIFQVVWVEPGELGWTIGVTALQDRNIWHMSFPTVK